MSTFFQRLDLLDTFWIKWINRGDRTTNYVELFDGTKFQLPSRFNTSILSYSEKTQTAVADVFEDFSVFHTSVPNIKLYYPEPFIASPNFAHEDIWFLHIVIYQYWLWFFFIYLIIFFFLAFLITVRWCNIRHRPVRETRGVSRSKCGDLITATVPVSWAASIIIHESTDAIELTDGFGSTEMAIGIRAYQWGWEYYYPKDLDLYSKKGSSTLRLGNSLNYRRATDAFTNKHSFKTLLNSSDYLDVSKTPASLLLGVNYNNLTAQNLNFGSNRLISRKASATVTSPRLLNINNTIHNPLTHFHNQNNLINLYVNFVYDETYQSKPVYQTSQLLTLSPLSLFRCSTNFSNLNDLVRLLDKTDDASLEILPSVKATQHLDGSNLGFMDGRTTLVKSNELTNNLNQTLVPGDVESLGSDTLMWSAKTNSWNTKLLNHYNAWVDLNNSAWPSFSLIADQDFKRWASQELLEELFWNSHLSQTDFESRQSSVGISTAPQLSDLSYFDHSENNAYFNDVFPDSSAFSNILTSQVFDQQLSVQKSWFTDSMDLSFLNLKMNLSILQLRSLSNIVSTLIPFPKLISHHELLNTYSMFQPSLTTLNLLSESELSVQNTYNGSIIANKYVSSLSPLFLLDKSNDSLLVAKSLNMFSQAFWKVFKSTLDEERSGFMYHQFSQTSAELPLVKSPMFSMLGLLQKEGTDFIQPHVWQLNANHSLDVLPLEKVWETFTFDFPFSLSFESDIMRYIWFDWYSTRNTIITKAIDTSVFSLYGAKQYNYTFTKDPKVSLLNKTDNFFVKYAHARRLYIPSYIYTPFFYSKFRDWSLNSTLPTLFSHERESISNFSNLLTILALEQTSNTFKTTYHPFTANYSNTSSPTRAYFTSATTTSNQIDALTTLFDILTKRDFLIRYVLPSKLNTSLLNSPSYAPSFTNPLVLQLKLASNYSFDNKYTLNPLTKLSTKRYFYNDYSPYSMYKNAILEQDDVSTLRSPYQPMRKGIVNMIRIQADKAVAMPTDTRLQILAVSKDIIHSWSIPSAGIKIDCIPGYSSHRVALFTLSGIYWGQCMEICGRFHHWMPIVVYFIRRDLFCVWCVHFVFKNKQINSVLQSFDSSFFDNSPAVSTDWTSWKYEL